MRLPAYSGYKDSGAELLGQVPEHWIVKRGRFVMQVNPRAPRLRALKPEDEVSFIPMDAVGEYGGLRLDQTKQIDEVGSGYTEFQDGDVVVAKITPCFENGKGALAQGLQNGVAYGTTELHVLRASPSLEQRYLFYLTISSLYRESGEAEMYGAGGQKRVPPEFNKDFRTPLPPLEEQQTISDFLDVQTAKIDALLAKKRELIDKLKEKRTTLISRTVIRGLPPEAARAAGLDPHPPMKNSGVEWLGEVPEQWGVSRIKFIVSTPVTDGPHETPEILDEGIPFVSAEAINNGRIDFTKIRGHITEEDHRRYSKKYCPKLEDIYMVKSGATTGRVAMVEDDRIFNIWSPLAAIRCRSNLAFSRYVYNYMQSKEFQTAVQLSWSYGTQQNIGMGVIQNLAVPLPSTTEQLLIADYLDREAVKIDQMVAKVEEAIDRLHEYRTALITAAVTGKINVQRAAA